MSKQNKGLVPELRFPEFRNDESWKALTLSELSTRITEKVGTKKLTTVSITAGLGFVSQAEKFSRDISGKQYKNYIHLRKGEYSYNKGNSKTFPQGCIYKLQEFDEAAAPNAFISFRFKKNHVGDFFRGYFDSNYHGRQLTRFITSGARSDGLLNISPSDFFSIAFPTPTSNSEQQKIADCLASIDELIMLHTQKLDALKDYKKGLMQQLFPAEGETVPKLRFPEFREQRNWMEVLLSTQVNLISGLHLAPDEYAEVGEIPYFTGPSDYTNNIACVSKWTKRSTNIGRYGDTIITVKGSGVGELLRLELDEVALGRQLMAIRSTSAHERFVFHFLATKRQLLIALASGNLIPGLSRPDILSLRIVLPKSAREQQMIADCLSSIDGMIALQVKKVDFLKTHKKGLIQRLFPVMDDAV